MRKVLKIVGGIFALIIVAAVAIYAVFALTSQPMPAHAFFRPDDPRVLVMAHQGGDGERPSNTMVAFQYAADLGVDVLEMDIHSTSDNVLVVIHDATIDRTTDGTGRVHDYTFEELQQFDAGYDWPTLEEESARTDRPFRGQGITIPALREIFETFPQFRMNIELKQEEPSIAQPLCDMLREYNLQEQVIVASFRARPMSEFRAACPEVATAAVEDEVRPFVLLNLVGLTPAYRPSAHSFQVPEYGGGFHIVTPGFIDAARAKNMVVQPWTINDEETMQRMIDLGVNGIITDYPTLLMQLLGRT